MSQFIDFNAENKLRLSLSAYAAQTIENDCINFARKRTTLINAIILNYYQSADCSISLRLKDRREELSTILGKKALRKNAEIIETILANQANEWAQKYTKKQPTDVSWQTTLNKKVKQLLTEDAYSCEEKYYGSRPGRYVHALIEEYVRLPYYEREEIIFRQILDAIDTAINEEYVLTVTNLNGTRLNVKPYKVMSDPLSMFHYLVCYSTEPADSPAEGSPASFPPKVLSLRISRLTEAEVKYFRNGAIAASEERRILDEISQKGVQFVSGDTSSIKIRLTEAGLRYYNSQFHLRPAGTADLMDDHIYYFECTEAQILYYFLRFGKDVEIISPASLRDTFRQMYEAALEQYR